MSDFLGRLTAAAAERDARGLHREVRAFDPASVLDLAGNDYLGLRTHPRVLDSAIAATRAYGAGAGASRLVTGTLGIHEDLERRLADLAGAPSALVLSSGYAANLATVTALADADTLIVSDAHAHASLIDGARLSRAGVAVARHNDIDHVRGLLATRTQTHALVIVESIYSVLGDRAPLRDLIALTAESGAVLVVDEAHALGAAGPGGAGLVAETLAGQAFPTHVVITATLSKAFGSQGGVVLARAEVREHLVNTARSFIYDTGLAPAAAGAALGALDVIIDQPVLLDQLQHNATQLAAACGIEPPGGAVMSVTMSGPEAALVAVDAAQAHGIRIGCFRPPSTPDGSSRLRITAHAHHSADQIATAATVLKELVHR
ncbi:MAG TPA: 8-amino-7-oxononanoate synthase [Phycicoccus sp.]|nr:8-amino-7-oxononanoate synthase [Phycicoccus sp.]HRA44673.1 8-amino-7-oxononanoate synthase [Phycicoccus sp.]